MGVVLEEAQVVDPEEAQVVDRADQVAAARVDLAPDQVVVAPVAAARVDRAPDQVVDLEAPVAVAQVQVGPAADPAPERVAEPGAAAPAAERGAPGNVQLPPITAT